MKILAILLCTGAAVYGTELNVELINPPSTGTVEVLLYDSPDALDNLREPVRSVRFPADGRRRFTLTDVAAGDYALMVHHDENGNAQIDKNFIGIPREPIGFANGYSPKGPPAYSRALVRVGVGEALTETVELRRPLGERGRIGAGLGAIVLSSPYRGADGGTFLPIPTITYTGDRLQIFGPRAQFGIIRNDKAQIAVVAQYRPAAYKEDDSPFLAGMGDRDSTLMAGASVKSDLPAGLDISLDVLHDALGQIGGSEASLFISRTFQSGAVRLTPKAGLNWTSARMANHDYGVPAVKARPGRPAYDTGDTVSPEIGLSLLSELGQSWWLVASLGAEFLPDDVTDSPLVSESILFKGFLAVQYVF